ERNPCTVSSPRPIRRTTALKLTSDSGLSRRPGLLTMHQRKATRSPLACAGHTSALTGRVVGFWYSFWYDNFRTRIERAPGRRHADRRVDASSVDRAEDLCL